MNSETLLLQRAYGYLSQMRVASDACGHDHRFMHPMRVVLGDGHRSFVEALAMRLDAECDLDVVATVSQPEQALRVIRAQPVDVAVLGVMDADQSAVGGQAAAALRPLAADPGRARVSIELARGLVPE